MTGFYTQGAEDDADDAPSSSLFASPALPASSRGVPLVDSPVIGGTPRDAVAQGVAVTSPDTCAWRARRDRLIVGMGESTKPCFRSSF